MTDLCYSTAEHNENHRYDGDVDDSCDNDIFGDIDSVEPSRVFVDISGIKSI